VEKVAPKKPEKKVKLKVPCWTQTNTHPHTHTRTHTHIPAVRSMLGDEPLAVAAALVWIHAHHARKVTFCNGETLISRPVRDATPH